MKESDINFSTTFAGFEIHDQMISYAVNCQHGRKARTMRVHRNPETLYTIHRIWYSWVETRKLFGLLRCCKGLLVESDEESADSPNRCLADERAVLLWNRQHHVVGTEAPPLTDFDLLVQWINSP